MRHQKFHLIGQNSAVAQNKIFPQAGHIGCVEQRHMRLLWRAGGLAVVAVFASGDDIHPTIHTALGIRDDVFAGELVFPVAAAIDTAVSANVAVTHEEFAIGEAGAQIEGVDAGHAFGADDGRNVDDALLTGDRVVPAAKCGHALAHFPTHLIGGVMDHRLLHADPALGQALR